VTELHSPSHTYYNIKTYKDNDAAVKINQRISMRKPVCRHNILVHKPGLKANVCLAILTGMIIGLIAAVILRFVEGKFF
jgi:hypothetical protein